VAQARHALLNGEELITLTGPGALTAAGAVATRAGGSVLCVRLAGAQSLPDAHLLVGWALGLGRPGREHAPARALAERTQPLVLLDARGIAPGLESSLRAEISSIALDTRWLVLLSEGEATPETIRAEHEADPTQLPTQLATHALALGWLLAGIPSAAELPDSAQVGGLQRQALRPELARALRQQANQPTAEIANALGARLQEHLRIATGGATPRRTSPADYFALRWIAAEASKPATLALAAAAAARLVLYWGMPSQALELLSQARLRTPSTECSCRAVLRWAHAQVALDTGDPQTARLHLEAAASLLRQERNLGLLATLTQRWAEVLFARGETAISAQHLRNARVLYRQLGHQAGVKATLRGAADIAIMSGETLSARTLLDQAEDGTMSAEERCNLQMSQASLSAAVGELDQAGVLLERAQAVAQTVPQLQANHQRRLADLALKTGQLGAAKEHALSARSRYARLGLLPAQALCSRLLGDTLSLQGALSEAARWYEAAIHQQISIGDLHGLHRSLTHAAALEHSCGDPTLARELSLMADRLPKA
jgi:tetratricopeptide (TPR) repeat protein